MATPATTTPTVNFWKTNVGKVVKAAIYLALSAATSYLITATSNDPVLFGSVTALVNLLLVFVKHSFLDDTTPNLWSN